TASAAQVARNDAFVLSARYPSGCGDLPRFRLRLRYDADCQALTGRIRSAGRLVAEFRAQRVDPDAPVTDPDADAVPPTIIGFSVSGAQAVGTIFTLFGEPLDRYVYGALWTNGPPNTATPPYFVRFAEDARRRSGGVRGPARGGGARGTRRGPVRG